MTTVTNVMNEDLEVVRTWKTSQTAGTVLVTIPHKLALKYGIKEHMNLLVTDTKDGILYKVLEIGK